MNKKNSIVRGLSIAILLLQLSFDLSAQQLPDFSGTWEMDAGRSDSFASKGHASHIIKQTSQELTIEHKGGSHSLVRHYKLDSSENNHDGGIRSRVRFDRDRLIIISYYPIKTIMGEWWVTSTVTHSLTADGNEMVTETAVTIDHGYTFSDQTTPRRAVDVFVRQAAP